MKLTNRNLSVAVALLSIASCGKKRGGGVSVTSELKLVSSGVGLASTSQMVSATALNEGEIQTDGITIESVKLPIFTISLGTGDSLTGGESAATIYSCSGSTAGACTVELVGTALQNLFSASTGSSTFSIPTGTYTYLSVGTCPSGAGSYTMTVKATATVNSTTYYTKSDGSLSTTAPSEDATVTLPGCANYSVLSQPITISQAGTVSLFADLRNMLAVGRTDSSGTVLQSAGVCGSSASSYVICATYPNVAGAVGVTSPTVERYVVKSGAAANTADTASVLAIFKDPTTGLPFGGYIRAFAQAGHVGPFTGTGNLKKTGAGTSSGIKWTGYAGADTSHVAGDGNYAIDNFTIATSDANGCARTTGTWSSAHVSTSNSANTIFACRLD